MKRSPPKVKREGRIICGPDMATLAAYSGAYDHWRVVLFLAVTLLASPTYPFRVQGTLNMIDAGLTGTTLRYKGFAVGTDVPHLVRAVIAAEDFAFLLNMTGSIGRIWRGSKINKQAGGCAWLNPDSSKGQELSFCGNGGGYAEKRLSVVRPLY